MGSFDTHYVQGSGIFSRFPLYKILPWRKHFFKVNVMLQFSGALTLRQQLDLKKQKKEQQNASLMENIERPLCNREASGSGFQSVVSYDEK